MSLAPKSSPDPGAQTADALRRVLDCLFTFVGILTPDGTMVEVNRAPLAAGGVTRDAVIGRKFWDTCWWSHSAEERERLREACRRAAAGEEVRYDAVIRTAGDGRMPIDFILTPIRDETGRITHLAPRAVDISERRRAEQNLRQLESELERRTAALRDSEELFRTTLQNAGVGKALMGLEGRWLEVNRELCRITGYDRDELLSRDSHAITHPDDRDADRNLLARALDGERASFQREKRFLHKQGHAIWVLMNASLVTKEDGKPRAFIVQIQDITARKVIEQAMQAVSAELGSLEGASFYQTATMRLTELLDADMAFVCTRASADAETVETVALVKDGAVAPNIRYPLEGTPCREVLGGKTMVIESAIQECYPRDDHFRSFRIEAYGGAPLADLDGRIVGHLCVLSRKPFRGEMPVAETLQIFGFAVAAALTRDRSRQRFEDLFEFAPDSIVMTDRDGTIRLVNQQAEQLFGWSRGELVGQPVEILLPDEARHAHPALREGFLRSARRRAMGSDNPDLRARRKDGTVFPVEISLSPMETEDGLMVAAAVRDVSDRKTMEAQLRQAQRLDAVGKLTGGVAHDFNNLLTVILWNAGEMETRLRGSQKLERLAASTKRAAIRAAELTNRLLAFSRRQPLDPKPTDVKVLLTQMEDLLKRTLGEHIEITVRSEEEPWPALVDAAQLENAVLNLCINARDAMPEGGRLVVELENVRLGSEQAGAIGEIGPGDYLMLAIADTGSGMDADTLAHAFEPFFTTKEVGKGSGLGLSMVYGFVKQSHGHIHLHSQVQTGTTVRIFLPRAEIESEVGDPDPWLPHLGEGSERILLVEDDELVRTEVALQLEDMGYTVVSAGNGPEALQVLARDQAFDLLFTDIVMPGGMTGRQLAERVREMKPEIPVLFTSGYSDNIIVHQGRLDPNVHLLAKPYLRQDLAVKIRSLLDAPRKAG